MAPPRKGSPQLATRILTWARGKEFSAQDCLQAFGPSYGKALTALCASGQVSQVRPGVYVERGVCRCCGFTPCVFMA